jgi:hypothetical protein
VTRDLAACVGNLPKCDERVHKKCNCRLPSSEQHNVAAPATSAIR